MGSLNIDLNQSSNKIISQPCRIYNSSTSPSHLPFVYSNLLKRVWIVFGLPSLYGGTTRWILSSRRHYRDCCVDTSVKRSRDAGLLKCATLTVEYTPVWHSSGSQNGAETVCQSSRSTRVEQLSLRTPTDAAAPNPAGNAGQRRVIRTSTWRAPGVCSSVRPTPRIQEDPLC